MLVVQTKSENGGGTKSFNFQSHQNVMNVNYGNKVNLTHSFFINGVNVSFEIADCGEMVAV